MIKGIGKGIGILSVHVKADDFPFPLFGQPFCQSLIIYRVKDIISDVVGKQVIMQITGELGGCLFAGNHIGQIFCTFIGIKVRFVFICNEKISARADIYRFPCQSQIGIFGKHFSFPLNRHIFGTEMLIVL